MTWRHHGVLQTQGHEILNVYKSQFTLLPLTQFYFKTNKPNIMKYLSLIICGLISFQLSAQNAVDKYFSNHLNNEKATVVQVSGKLFQYAAALVPDEISSDEEFPVEDAKDFLSGITSFTLVKIDSLDNSQSEYKRGINSLGAQFEELVRVRDKNNKVSILIDETNDVIHEIVALVTTENEFLVAALTGELRLDQVQDIVSKIQSENVQSLMEGADVNLAEMKVYPNPTTAGVQLMIEIPQKMVGGNINVFDLSGNLIKSMDVTDKRAEINTDQLGAGQYIVEIDKAGVTLKKKFIVVD